MNAIREALSKLDILNDNHWTADGLPRLEPVRMLVGNQSLSREEVTKAAPGFSRQTPKLDDAVQNDVAATQAAANPPTAAGNEALLNAAPTGVVQAAAATSVEAGGENGEVQSEGQASAEIGSGDAGDYTAFAEVQTDVAALEEKLAAAQERMAELELHKVQVDRSPNQSKIPPLPFANIWTANLSTMNSVRK
jgi:hypothetical protein